MMRSNALFSMTIQTTCCQAGAALVTPHGVSDEAPGAAGAGPAGGTWGAGGRGAGGGVPPRPGGESTTSLGAVVRVSRLAMAIGLAPVVLRASDTRGAFPTRWLTSIDVQRWRTSGPERTTRGPVR